MIPDCVDQKKQIAHIYLLKYLFTFCLFLMEVVHTHIYQMAYLFVKPTIHNIIGHLFIWLCIHVSIYNLFVYLST